MRRISIAVCALLAPSFLQPARADDATAGDVCVGVSINGTTLDNLSCLNARLRQSVIAAKNRSDQSLNLEGGVANAPAPALDIFNETATHERLGDAFGQSAYPQRPEKTYANPLTSGR